MLRGVISMKDGRFKVPISVQLILAKENSILLLRRFNTGYADGHYCLPAGHVEENEEAKEAMIREAKEEIGIDLVKDNLELVHVLHRKAVGITYIDFIFKATEWNGKIKLMESDKCDEIRWVSLTDLPSNVIPFTRKLLETKDMYIPYGWSEYEQKLDEAQHMNSDTDENNKE